jgi:hypothetical protein
MPPNAKYIDSRRPPAAAHRLFDGRDARGAAVTDDPFGAICRISCRKHVFAHRLSPPSVGAPAGHAIR